MHQECPVGNVYDLDSVDIGQRSHDFLILCLARGVYGNVSNQKIFSYADYIDALDITARLSDSGSDLAEFTGLIVDSDAKSEAVAGVRCWFTGHNLSVPRAVATGDLLAHIKKYAEKAGRGQIRSRRARRDWTTSRD